MTAMHATRLLLPFLAINLAVGPVHGQTRWLDPARDAETLPQRASLLFLSGDEQIAGFRNIDRIGNTREIPAGATVHRLPRAERDFGGFHYEVAGRRHTLDDFLEHNHVAGLLVLKNGEIALERYGLGNTEESRWVSFSMTKSVVSMLTGAAIADGYIASVDDMVTDYLPRLRGTSYEGVRIRDVLQMASGVEWNEDYADPTSDVASSPGNMLQLMHYLGAKERVAPPGERFNYNTGETNLAGAVVRAAIGNNLATYLSHRIWGPWGMERDANWLTHGPGGGELGGCCISATLRDWGRLALFAMGGGVLHDGTRVLPEGWMRESTMPSQGSEGYGYLWWLGEGGTYRASGIFGQGIYFNPATELVIVVQGAWPTATGAELSRHRDAFFQAMDDHLR
jgi:CubicO group peptidase (beta-lactamase class C family)